MMPGIEQRRGAPGLLRLEGIQKRFPGHLAVAGVDLTVVPGEMVVLLGPSGCGKSTLLRIVAGIETATAGRVWLGDRDLTDLPPQRRDVAMVFQNYALYPHMSVRDNLAFGLRMRRMPRAAIATRVAEVAASLGLETLLERRPSQLSGGQRQRVALGRAIARKAKVFLLDEPLSNLDVQLRVTTRGELARLHRSLDVPMLYVTHDQEEAMTLGDRVAVMRDGRFEQIGTPLEIYDRPATRFVAGFVGSPRMNFLSGTLRHNARHHVLTVLGNAIDIPAADSGSAEPSGAERDIVAGIRPEHVELVAPQAGDLAAQVDVVEPLGRETILHVLAGPAPGSPMQLVVPGGAAPRPGDAVGLKLRRNALHLFDAGTGQRLDG
jgi:multiple sugar transport system ATP-binding protein